MTTRITGTALLAFALALPAGGALAQGAAPVYPSASAASVLGFTASPGLAYGPAAPRADAAGRPGPGAWMRGTARGR